MKRWLYGGLVIVIVIILGYFAGRFLVIDETPAKADTIIVLSGDKGRLEKGVELFQAGYADKLIVTRTDGPGGLPMKVIERSGLPMSAFIPEKSATSTYTNALYAKEIMDQLSMKSALVVSSNYHMRRVKFSFETVFSGTDTKLTYIAADSNHFDPHKWWSKMVYLKFTVFEYIKLLGYIVKYWV